MHLPVYNMYMLPHLISYLTISSCVNLELSNQPRPGPSQAEREGVPAEASQDGRLKKGDTVKIGVDLDTLQAVLKESKNWNERIVEVHPHVLITLCTVYIGMHGKPKSFFHHISQNLIEFQYEC